MMFDASSEVSKFHDKKVVLPSTERTKMRERRNANRERLKKNLADSDKPKPVGLYSQGSYAMRTMVQDDAFDYDIDDGVYFAKDKLVGPNGGEMSALAVRQMVCDALQDERFSKAPEALKNCVRVYYNEGYHVDVPAYRQIEEKDPWTGKLVFRYELASSEWKKSDPREVTNWFKQQNEQLSPDASGEEGQFCRVVRLLKMFSRSRESWKGKTATGFMITRLVAEKYVVCGGRDDLSLRETMKAIDSRLQWNQEISHPVLGGEKITGDNDGRPAYFRERLKENLKHLEILDQAECSHANAMSAWDKVFSTDWFSEQPEPEGGSKKSHGEPSTPAVKLGEGRFA